MRVARIRRSFARDRVEFLDASGEPSNDENVASDEFEKAAIEKLLRGEAFVDEVITVKGNPYLRAATPIPVAHKKCVLCHENYAAAKEFQPIGALVYTVPIEWSHRRVTRLAGPH
ncbi:MAG: DUF3365 domain-containing protein [Planctomycetes bacterium]|nr:DUF3365 domain-containing protein [Planctomycetota bacterium]